MNYVISTTLIVGFISYLTVECLSLKEQAVYLKASSNELIATNSRLVDLLNKDVSLISQDDYNYYLEKNLNDRINIEEKKVVVEIDLAVEEVKDLYKDQDLENIDVDKVKNEIENILKK